MALRCTASASKRPEEVRKPQQGLAARFKLCGRKPLRGLPPSPRWTWRCALREANVRKGLGGYTRSSGTYLGPSGCANAPRGFVLEVGQSSWLPEVETTCLVLAPWLPGFAPATRRTGAPVTPHRTLGKRTQCAPCAPGLPCPPAHHHTSSLLA